MTGSCAAGATTNTCDAHNLYLERLGELGMVVFVPVLLRLASELYPALRARWHPATPA